MTKPKATSDAFKSWYGDRVEYNSTRSGYFLTAKSKPNKRVESEAHNIFASFGGFEVKQFKWEFTYDPRIAIRNAIDYGYIINAHDNWAFLPSQIEKTMNSFFALPSQSNVLFMRFGYGYTHIDQEAYRYHVCGSLIHSEQTISNQEYHGILYRPSFKGELELLQSSTNLLCSNGLLVCIITNAALRNKKMEDYVVSNYNTYNLYSIPHQTWNVPESTDLIKANILVAKKK